MPSQTRSAGTFTEGNLWGVGSYHWVDGGNMTTSDNTYAVVTRTGGNLFSYTALLTNFGFAIPAGSIINKITAKIEAKSNHAAANRVDWVILLTGGVTSLMQAMGSYPSDVAPDEPLTESDVIYSFNPYQSGDPNLWGYAWTPTLINSSTFGVGFDCMLSARDHSVSVDHVQITVDYTEGEPEPGICENLECGVGYQSIDDAIKAIIGKYTGMGYLDCVGLKLSLELKNCATLTELKDCGTTYTLEQAFKAALKQDGCGGATLRAFIMPPDEWLPN